MRPERPSWWSVQPASSATEWRAKKAAEARAAEQPQEGRIEPVAHGGQPNESTVQTTGPAPAQGTPPEQAQGEPEVEGPTDDFGIPESPQTETPAAPTGEKDDDYEF